MQNLSSKVVEALGYRWFLTSCDIDAEDGRSELQGFAQRYLAKITRPAHRTNVNFMLFPYYADILAALEKLETLDGKDTTALSWDWAGDVDTWVEFIKSVKADGKAEELSDLWDVAQKLNPDWYPKLQQLMDEETKQAASNLDAINSFVESPDNSPHPDTAEAVKDSTKVLKAVETSADAGGLVGPASFSSKRKGAA
jgi:hypothetical protein